MNDIQVTTTVVAPADENNPPTYNDAANQLMHVEKLKDLKRSHPTAFPDKELVTAELKAQQV
jgi:hypothetical protein